MIWTVITQVKDYQKLGHVVKYELAWPKGLSRIIRGLANPDHPGFFPHPDTILSSTKEKKKDSILYWKVGKDSPRPPLCTAIRSSLYHISDIYIIRSSLYYISTNPKVEENFLYFKTGFKCHLICDRPIRNCACTQYPNNF